MHSIDLVATMIEESGTGGGSFHRSSFWGQFCYTCNIILGGKINFRVPLLRSRTVNVARGAAVSGAGKMEEYSPNHE